MNSTELYEKLKEYTPIELYWLERFKSGDYPETSERFDDMLNHFVSNWYMFSKNVGIERHSRFYPHYFHSHNYLEVMYLISGECQNISDEDSVRLEPGDMCFVPPGAWHLPLAGRDSILMNFCIRKSWITELVGHINRKSALTAFLKGLSDPKKPRWLLVKSHLSPEIIDCADRMVISSLEQYEDSDYEAECLFGELILKTIKHCGDDVETGSFFSTDTLISEIIQVIGSEYLTLTLDELASRLNYSKSHICRVIRAEFGTTFSAIVNGLKVSDACRMLRSSKCQVSEIAYSCGFISVEHFTRTFRRYTGVSPSGYKKGVPGSPEPPFSFQFIKA